MRYQFPNTGVCSSQVAFDLNDGIVTNVKFTGGCNGNTQGVAKLAEGMPIDVLIERLQPFSEYFFSGLKGFSVYTVSGISLTASSRESTSRESL